MLPAFFSFFRMALAILCLLLFHITFRIICPSSTKNIMGNLMEIALNLYVVSVVWSF